MKENKFFDIVTVLQCVYMRLPLHNRPMNFVHFFSHHPLEGEKAECSCMVREAQYSYNTIQYNTIKIYLNTVKSFSTQKN